MFSIARARLSSLRPISVTSLPATAYTCATPWPMMPLPMTASVSNVAGTGMDAPSSLG